MILKIQRSWRQFHDITVIWSLLTRRETTICGTWVSFRHPFTPNSLFASVLAWTSWVGAPKLTLSPRTGNPRYSNDHTVFDSHGAAKQTGAISKSSAILRQKTPHFTPQSVLHLLISSASVTKHTARLAETDAVCMLFQMGWRQSTSRTSM